MESSEFYAKHLQQVSRSFSFCIARLEGNLKLYVGLSYLILRVLDTVEDAVWPSREQQQRAFFQFNQFVRPPQAGLFQEQWNAWVSAFPEGLPVHEQALLKDSFLLFRDLQELPLLVRDRIQNSVLNMSRGMMHFQAARPDSKSEPSRFELRSLAELNGYCFFVAGVVGELLTDLLQIQSAEFKPTSQIYIYAVQFGLFLQKINILKDQLADEQEGRHLVHLRSEVFESLKQDVTGAFNYLRSIPKTDVGYRLFCGWSLFIGLESLPWIQKSWALKIFEKIPRVMTKHILDDIEGIILDDEALNARFTKLKKAISWSNDSDTAESEAVSEQKAPQREWISQETFDTLYTGRVQWQQLLNVGGLPLKA